MKAAINEIPVSLYKTLSEKLVSIILDAESKDAVSAEMTKKIIYLWRQDSLASPTGIETLVTAGNTVNEIAPATKCDHGAARCRVRLWTETYPNS